jgi:hypothetical protein
MSLNQITSTKTVRLAIALKREYTRSFFSGAYEAERSTHVRAPVASLSTAEISAMEWEQTQREFSLMHAGAVAAVAMHHHPLHIICYPQSVPVSTKRVGARRYTRFVGAEG